MRNALQRKRIFNACTDLVAASQSLTLSCPEGLVRVEGVAEGVVRLTATCRNEVPAQGSQVVTLPAGPGAASVTSKGMHGQLESLPLRLTIDGAPLSFTVALGDQRIMASSPQGAVRVNADGGLSLHLQLDADLSLYGLGEKNGTLDKRGRRWLMENREPLGIGEVKDPLYESFPFLLVMREGMAIGVYLDVVAHSYFDLGRADPSTASIGSSQDTLVAYFIAGPSPKEVITRFTALVGRPELPPRWALGYHQSRWGYMTATEVRQVANEFRARDIPCDAIHLDIDYMDGWRVFTWHPKRFPHPKELIDDLASQGIKVVAIMDPGVKVDTTYRVYQEGVAGHHFLKRKDGREYHGNVWPGRTAFPDFSRPATRQWWADHLAALLELGVAGIWNDMNEPAYYIPRPNLDTLLKPWMKPDDVVFYDDGRYTPFWDAHNLYANHEAHATVDAFQQHAPKQRPFVLSRSAFCGIQRYAAVWTGDCASRFPHLAQTIPMLLNMGLCGAIFCGADIGGFAMSCTPELYARWIQLGIFYPLCRTHSMKFSRRQEPWSFGERTTDIARAFIKLRYQLLPLVVTLFREAAQTGLPPMRPLFLEFPSDIKAHRQDYEFMFGSELLVAPVLKAKQTKREVYFPRGVWYDWYSNAKYPGGSFSLVDAPLEVLPLFVRGGAIIPLWADCTSAVGELPTALTLRVYPDAERPGAFLLYDDQGEGYDYRHGQYRCTPYTCTADERQVVVERKAHEGELDYALETVTLEVCLEQAPTAVSFEGKRLRQGGEGGWLFDDARSCLRLKVAVPDGPWRLVIDL